MILAIDPGRDKCGLAVVTNDQQVIDQQVVVRKKLKDDKNAWLGFAHGNRKEDLENTKTKLIKEIKANNNFNLKIYDSRISATLGCHVGPTVYAVIILSGDFLA